MNALQSTESTVFTMNAKEDTVLKYGKRLQTALTVYLSAQLLMKKLYACTVVYPLILLT